MKKMMKVATFVAMVLAAGFVSCQEKIPDYLIVDGTTLTGYTDGMPANLVIPKGITKIAGGAFVGCNRLESVTIPGSVKTIGEDVTLEEAEEKDMDVEDLLVFYNCGSLRNVTIEKGVKTIGFGAFFGCKSLTSVTIPNSVTKIGMSAFSDCDSLASVTIPKSVAEIGEFAFRDCEIIAVTYEGSLKDWCAAGWASFISPDDVKRIMLSDGTDLKKLTKITAKDLTGVTKISDDAFYGCTSLASVEIPKSVTEISEGAFRDCEIIAVTYKGSLKDWCAVDWDYFLLHNAKRMILSDGTDLKKLTKITASDLAGVTKIGKDAFYECKSLTSVTISNGVTKIGDDAFYGCMSLANVTIPGSVTSIGGCAFNSCTSLTSVEIPDSVTEIGWAAFAGCKSLTSVTIPGSVTSIGHNAFGSCTSLKTVHYDGTKKQFEAIISGDFNLPEGAIISCKDGNITE